MATEQVVTVELVGKRKVYKFTPEQWVALQKLKVHLQELVRQYDELYHSLSWQDYRLIEPGDAVGDMFAMEIIPRLEALQEV